MMRRKTLLRAIRLVAVLAMASTHGQAQMTSAVGRPFASNIIVPQTRAFPVGRAAAVRITEVEASVRIVEQVATTTLDIGLHNPSSSRLEAELIVPVPEGAAVRGFSFQGAGSEPTAELLPGTEARRIYDEMVAKIRDPALLEFIGYNLIRSSVFPVEGNGDQKVRLVYEHLLLADGDRVDYALPRSDSLEYAVPWSVSVRVESKRPISTVYSPSHGVEAKRIDKGTLTVKIAGESTREPGAFRLSYLLEQNGVTASLMAYPDPKVGGGYFLLLAGLPADVPQNEDDPSIKREVTLVLDRSGSMNGEKLEQVREAALQILAGLEEGEAFNLAVYNEGVDPFSAQPVLKTRQSVESARAYLRAVNARGGTNIHDALVEALRQPPTEDVLPIVLFLTDGLPTIGQTSEVAIREVAEKGNPYHRRIFTFGVGLDVNTPLLSAIASDTRATSTFVLPKEDVEVKIARVFEQLSGPVLANPDLVAETGRTQDLVPTIVPDLFEGDQLVVLGKYVGDAPLAFTLTGNYLGKERRFQFRFDLDKATTKNAFVPRLWATRKIGVLLEAIRRLGGNGRPTQAHGTAAADPKMKELVDEVVRLSTEFGILTEYTAFLAREGTDLTDLAEVHRIAASIVDGRNVYRAGIAALNQEANVVAMKQQAFSNADISNRFYDDQMNRVAVSGIQQVNDLAFYRRGNQWVDSRIVDAVQTAQPARVVEFGSKAFRDLAYRLAEQNRQGSIALRGDILLEVDGETLLVKGPQ